MAFDAMRRIQQFAAGSVARLGGRGSCHGDECEPGDDGSFHRQACRPQVFMPSIEYNGQVPKTPVSTGTTPIQPHHPTMPVMASPIRSSPTMTRKPRSMLPTFVFMIALSE